MGKVLSEREAEAFLEKEGFPVIERRLTKTVKEAIAAADAIGYPVALKVDSRKILHKSDVGGVKLDLRNAYEVETTFKAMMSIKHAQGVTVQRYTHGVFMLLGLKEDSSFGHALVAGSGGIYTEVLKDVSFRVCPVDEKEAKKMLEELRMYPLLEGARGKDKINVKQLCTLLSKLSRLVKKYPKLKELDINPLILNGEEMVVVDARMSFT